MSDVKTAVFIIFRSHDGETDWKAVKPEDVPEWIKAPDVMGRLAQGSMARNDFGLTLPDDVGPWYRAQQVVGPVASALIDMQQAQVRH